ncbi:MAG TPA: ATP-binding cassette domain-containing protein [Nitrososphaeraceae archaeon]|jgi:ABC-2 type transport system ATP-binding protein|nr:ATP-binding cassette domain-containing protein [Nitrososphaeraceae archaeon]
MSITGTDKIEEIYHSRLTGRYVSSENAIVVKGLRKSFKQLTVLDDVNFVIKKGTVLALLGPNGAGKTTTIRILSTLLLPDSGQVLINGFDVVKEAYKVRSLIGLTGQYAALDEYLTGKENLHMIGRLYRLSYPDINRRSQELLELFDLVEASGRTVKTYSGGMHRRLDLAVSLIASPPIIFLDEPTTGLDPRSRLIMWDIIEQLVSTGTTILLTTQDMDEADHLADRIVVINGGKIIAEGTSDELKQRVGSERLEITVAKESNFEKAKKVVEEDSLHSDSKMRTLSLVTKGGMHQLKQVLSRLDEAGIDVENVSFRSPTLDDVFLTVTGHTTEQPNGETKEQGG